MKRFWKALWLMACISPVALVAHADNPYGKFLPPDQAFQLTAQRLPHAIVLDWHIAEGYYLYRNKFAVATPTGPVGDIVLPPGEVEHDPYFGKVEIYRREVRFKVPDSSLASGTAVKLKVTYQGCADAGLCYTPIVKHLKLSTKTDTQ